MYIVIAYGVPCNVDIRSGEGLKKLFEVCRPRIKYLAQSYYIDGQDTEDKIQDLEIKLWQIIPGFNPSKSCFATYMTNCLSNYIKNRIKYNSLRSDVVFESLTEYKGGDTE